MKGIQGTSNKTYRQLLGNGLRYEIPKFQRDYTWGLENWDDLWSDLKNVLSEEDNEHYMGYLVLQTSNNKDFLIIDGQQRLTTISLIILATLKALQQLADSNIDKENNLKRKESLLNSYIGYVDPVTLISNNKMKLNKSSDDYYRQYIVLLKDLPLRNTNTSEKQMRECFNWYFDRISKDYKTGEDLASFVDKIVDKLFFTVIEVTDQLNAFKVFETLNARGVQLSSADLLKNYLFSIVDDSNPSKIEMNELEKLWSNIVGKLGERKFEDYLRYYWNSTHKSIGKKNLFKAIKTSLKTKDEVFTLVRQLNDTADIYLAIQEPEDILWREYPEIRKHLKELKLFQIKQTYSLFLSGYTNLAINQFEKLVKICSIISFRYNIIGGLNPNEQEVVYNKIALDMLENKTFKIQDFSSIYVIDSSFENDFSTKTFKNTTRNHKVVKYILTKIEKYQYHNDIDPESDLFTVEHILPESANIDWGNFSDEEINRSIYRIGNLTLLEKKLNSEASILEYESKKNIYERSQSKLTQSIPINYNQWNEDKVSSRQRELAKHAKAIWKINE
jgi:uncharacterized protein with ParB-like and HNH nuclease domain